MTEPERRQLRARISAVKIRRLAARRHALALYERLDRERWPRESLTGPAPTSE